MVANSRGHNTRVDELMREGREALDTGQTRLAHDLWREAATLDPYDERVWLALLEVIEAGEDRRVALENIVAINPLNVEARRQLRELDDPPIDDPFDDSRRPAPARRASPRRPASAPASKPSARSGAKRMPEAAFVPLPAKPQPRSLFARVMDALIVGLLVGVPLGIAASIAVYAYGLP